MTTETLLEENGADGWARGKGGIRSTRMNDWRNRAEEEFSETLRRVRGREGLVGRERDGPPLSWRRRRLGKGGIPGPQFLNLGTWTVPRSFEVSLSVWEGFGRVYPLTRVQLPNVHPVHISRYKSRKIEKWLQLCSECSLKSSQKGPQAYLAKQIQIRLCFKFQGLENLYMYCIFRYLY